MIWRGIPPSSDSVVRSTSCRRTTSFRARSRTGMSKAAGELDGRRNVIRGATRFQLIEKPEPLLRERGRQRGVAIDWLEWRRRRKPPHPREPARRVVPPARELDLQGNLPVVLRHQTCGGAATEAERQGSSGLPARRNCRGRRPIPRRATRSRYSATASSIGPRGGTNSAPLSVRARPGSGRA